MKKLFTFPIQPKQTSNERNNQSDKVIKVYVVQSEKERTEKTRSSVKTVTKNPFQQGASLHEVEAVPENTCVHYCRFD